MPSWLKVFRFGLCGLEDFFLLQGLTRLVGFREVRNEKPEQLFSVRLSKVSQRRLQNNRIGDQTAAPVEGDIRGGSSIGVPGTHRDLQVVKALRDIRIGNE